MLLVPAATEVLASNGTVMSGYGIKNITMGGVGTALPLDSIAAANNPAGMAKVGSRVDLGVRVFRGLAHNTYLSEGNTNSINMTTAFPEMGLTTRWMKGRHLVFLSTDQEC